MLQGKRRIVSIVLAVTVITAVAPLLIIQDFRMIANCQQQMMPPTILRSSLSNRTDSNETATAASEIMALPFANKSNDVKTSSVRTAALNTNLPKNASLYFEHSPERSISLPLLSTLVGDKVENITGDVQFLLDFAIIGHFKCGTTTFLQWMKDHDETLVIPQESYSLHRGKPAGLVHRLYRLRPPTDKNASSSNTTTNITIRRGYKCPNDIQRRRSLRYLRNYFPKTKLIVGVRHPIRWLESFYNFRIQNSHTTSNTSFMPHPNKLIGACRRGTYHVCTDSSLFHVHLAGLGKTSLTEEEIQESFHRYRNLTLEDGEHRPDRIPNPVFLYEVTQLKPRRRDSPSALRDQQRSLQFRRDVQAFLGLQHELPPIPHELPDQPLDDPLEQAARDVLKIRICENEYLPVRKHLLKQSIEASVWIRKHFLNATGVFVSSRNYLESLLEKWMYDPCENTTTTKDSRLS